MTKAVYVQCDQTGWPRADDAPVHQSRSPSVEVGGLGEMGQGQLVGPDAERMTLANLKRMVLDDYGFRGNRTTVRAEQCLAHVLGYFGETARALDVTADRLVAYAKARQDEHAAPATEKNELAILPRGFNLAVRAGRLPQRPAFPAIEARNRRTGFFEAGEFRAVAAQLDGDVRPLAEFFHLTGWRRGEALALEWRNVDFGAGVVRIEGSKNGEPRTLPFKALPELAMLIERQRERARTIEQAAGRISRGCFSVPRLANQSEISGGPGLGRAGPRACRGG